MPWKPATGPMTGRNPTMMKMERGSRTIFGSAIGFMLYGKSGLNGNEQ